MSMYQNISNSNNKSGLRIPSVDIFRGLSVLLMIDAHIPISIGWISEWSNVLAAPFFLIIAGLSYDLFLFSRKQKTTEKKYLHVEVLSRGFLIYALPLVPYIIISILFTIPFIQLPYVHRYSVQIFHWGVFQVIGAGYILGILIPNNLKSKVFFVIFTFISTFIISNFHQNVFYFLIKDIYAFFPWVGYFICGRIFYELYNISFKDKTLLGFSLLSFISSLLIMNTFKVDFLLSARDQFPMFLFISSFCFIIFTLMIIFIDRRKFYHYLFNLLENIGKISFTSYYIHFPILFFIIYILKIFFGSTISFEYFSSLILNIIILLLIITTLSYVEKNWRNCNYIFGFEWFVRTGSQILIKLAT
jgi:hypothetical protein